MRKALIALIMAATVMTPIAAEAQDRGRRDGEARAERIQQRNERRAARQEQRQARQEARQQQAPARAQQRQQAVVQRERSRSTPNGYQRGWQGPNTPAYREDANRYNRLARENAIRYGTRGQARDAVRDARQERREDRRDWRQDRREDRRDRRDWRRDRREDRREWRQERRDWRNWNRGWRNDNRYNWRDWRYSHRNIYRGSRYYAPYRDWSYRRFSIGLILDPLFYGQRYWIGDPWQYRLPPAPPGAQWVRYYNDVLLVDTYSGEIIDVIYDFFW